MSKAMREKGQARFEYLGSPRVTGNSLEEREKSKQENEEMAKRKDLAQRTILKKAQQRVVKSLQEPIMFLPTMPDVAKKDVTAVLKGLEVLRSVDGIGLVIDGVNAKKKQQDGTGPFLLSSFDAKQLKEQAWNLCLQLMTEVSGNLISEEDFDNGELSELEEKAAKLVSKVGEMPKTFTNSTKVTLKLFEAAASDLAL